MLSKYPTNYTDFINNKVEELYKFDIRQKSKQQQHSSNNL